MLRAITEWMNGDYAGKTMLVLRMLFFLLFIVTSFAVCPLPSALAAERGRRGRTTASPSSRR